MEKKTIIKAPAEILYRDELDALKKSDSGKRPPGWQLSPNAIRTFILGSKINDQKTGEKTITIQQKFYGDDNLVDRCIVTLISNRGLLLVGEAGTAKSMLSELLCAAISGASTNTIQGTAGTTEDQIKYSWNYALLLSQGPGLISLVPAPLYTGLTEGKIVRFEEITRCQPEIQDTLISIMSDKILHIPELKAEQGAVCAKKGFNILATANTRDRGVHEMSSALKRRFNFETVFPIKDKKTEMKLIHEQTKLLLQEADIDMEIPVNVLDVLVTTFHDLKNGQTEDGIPVEKPTTIMSTAEAVAVGVSAGIDAYYFGKQKLDSGHIARQIMGTVFKDDPEDMKKFRHYFHTIVKKRAHQSRDWKDFWNSSQWLNRE